jgi:subtilisin family serine protease
MAVQYQLLPMEYGQVSMDPALQRLRAGELPGNVGVVARIHPEKLDPPTTFEKLKPGQVLAGDDGLRLVVISKIGKCILAGDGYIITARLDPGYWDFIGKAERTDRNPWLLSIKFAPAARPQLHKTVNLALGDKAPQPRSLSARRNGLTGKGVIVGVVDYGCDFASPALRVPSSGKTRLLALWDQNDPQDGQTQKPPPGFGYGTEYTRDEINKALSVTGYTWKRAVEDFEQEPAQTGSNHPLMSVYRSLGYDPVQNPFNYLYREPPQFYSAHVDIARNSTSAADGRRSGDESLELFDAVALHGTHVLDIAAGSCFKRPYRLSGTSEKLEQSESGMAPKADLVFVQVRKTAWQGTAEFTASSHILDAVRYILDQADRTDWLGPGPRPVVINLSLNAYAGPHDGRTLLEMGLDAMADERANTAIVISAANNQRTVREHRVLKTRSGQQPPAQLDWDLGQPLKAKNRGSSVHEVEIWYPEEVPAPRRDPLRKFAIGFRSQDDGDVWLSATGDSERARCDIGQAYKIRETRDGQAPRVIGEVYSRYGDPNNGKGTINLILYESVAEREWIFEFAPVDRELTAHAWIEFNQENPSSFKGGDRGDDNFTLGSVCGTERCIVVGSHACAPPDWWGQLSPSEFTSRGPTLPAANGRGEVRRLDKPDLLAPGEGTCRRSIDGAKYSLVAAAGRYGAGPVLMQGTSQAAPHVAGAVALLLQRAADAGHSLSSEEILDLLHGSGVKASGKTGWDPREGYGLLNVDSLTELVERKFCLPPGRP